MTRNKLIATLFIVLMLILIGIILAFRFAFYGNPITKVLADKAIKKYVEQNYSFLDLEVDKTLYNFKAESYMAQATSKTSVDTHFYIYYRDGKIIRDEYETNVLGKYNTLERWAEECSQLVVPILAQVPGLENNRSRVEIDKSEYEKPNKIIRLDMNFDKGIPINMKLHIRADLTGNSLKNIAEIFEKSHQVLLNNGYVFSAYNIFSENQEVLIMVNDVKPSDIDSGELEKLLLDAQGYSVRQLAGETTADPPPSTGITIFIKDGSKSSNKL